jgi:diguanylate cyclase (GGDEF)-like protein
MGVDGVLGQDRGRDDPRGALGMALGCRAAECAELVERRLRDQLAGERGPGEAFFDSRPAVVWFSTILVARWLAYDTSPGDQELAWISERGRVAASDQISIDHLLRASLVWRDVSTQILTEEAGRLRTPPGVLAAALDAVRRSCDGGIVRTARTFAVHLRDVSERLDAERAALRHDTLHDQLTGLPNRTLLYDRIDQQLRRAQRSSLYFAVLLVDLDGFKAVNDTLGHRMGDFVLHEAAARLASAVRDTDTVARLGGDEFVAVLSGADHDSATATVARMLDSLTAPLSMEGRVVTLGASVGIAVYPTDGNSVRELLSAADHAMYAAKARQRGNQIRRNGVIDVAPTAAAAMRRLTRPELSPWLIVLVIG